MSSAPTIYLGWIGDKGGVMLVGQLSPPVVSLVPAREIQSAHKVAGRVEH